MTRCCRWSAAGSSVSPIRSGACSIAHRAWSRPRPRPRRPRGAGVARHFRTQRRPRDLGAPEDGWSGRWCGGASVAARSSGRSSRKAGRRLRPRSANRVRQKLPCPAPGVPRRAADPCLSSAVQRRRDDGSVTGSATLDSDGSATSTDTARSPDGAPLVAALASMPSMSACHRRPFRVVGPRGWHAALRL
jgi:hypothetical protein